MRAGRDRVLVQTGLAGEIERLLEDLARVLLLLGLERSDRIPVHLRDLIDRFIRVGGGLGARPRSGKHEQGGERSDAKQRADRLPHAVLCLELWRDWGRGVGTPMGRG
jgi:hypothetical protein